MHSALDVFQAKIYFSKEWTYCNVENRHIVDPIVKILVLKCGGILCVKLPNVIKIINTLMPFEKKNQL
jgi:hypothetical protein